MKNVKHMGSDMMYAETGNALMMNHDPDAAKGTTSASMNDDCSDRRTASLNGASSLVDRIRERSIIPIQLTAILLLALTGCERYALDRQMDELCKKDGGIKIYEKVILPATYFNATGGLILGPAVAQSSDASSRRIGEDEYRIVTHQIYIAGSRSTDVQGGHGVLVRVRVSIIRSRDKFLLGEQVWYHRGGGDGFTFGFQPSGKSCPLFTQDLTQLVLPRGS